MMEILVDLDPAVYACGFAAQKTTYTVVYETTEDEPKSIQFVTTQDKSAGAAMKEWIDEQSKTIDILDKHKLVVADPISHCLHILLRHLDTITAACVEKFGRCDFRYFLSGSNNFRYNVASRVPYKGNRLPESRPLHYTAIRQYLEEHWNPSISDGCEADDEISIAAEQAAAQHKDTCVVSIDKDLDQIGGWHYNPNKKVFYQQDRDSALLYLYQQILSGDSTDNIPGCYRIGAERAETLITSWTEDYEGISRQVEQNLWRNIVGTYIASTGKRGCPYTEEEAESVAIETARLVYIQRAPYELWNPPGEEFGRTDDFLQSIRQVQQRN